MRKFLKAIFAPLALLPTCFFSGCRQVNTTFTAAQLSDIHLRHEFNSKDRFKAFAKNMRTKHPDISIILNTGDVLDGHKGKWDYWTSTAEAEFGDLPIYSLFGNHDFEADIKDTNALCKLLSMPGRYYSFDNHKWRFFMLDGNTFHREVKQIEWLKKELSEIPEDMHAVILCHQPLTSNSVFKGIVASCPNVKLCLFGHTHSYEREVIDRVTYIEGGAVSGYWWEKEASTDGKGGYEGTPMGFGLIEFHPDGTFDYEYVAHEF